MITPNRPAAACVLGRRLRQNLYICEPMTLVYRKGDLIRLTVPTTSGWQGIGVVLEPVHQDDDPDTVVPFRKQGEDDDTTPCIALLSEVEPVAQRHPEPVSPAEGEDADEARYLVTELRDQADDMSPSLELFGLIHRAADLLERLASPACVVLKPSPELIEAFKGLPPGRIEPLLAQRHPAPVPVAIETTYEFCVYDENHIDQAGGWAPTYAEVLSEGRRYLAQYQQDGPHTLELRRVEVLNPDALPLPAGEQRHPEPVPVSERLPGPEDCDGEGLCWWLIEPYPRPVGPGGKLWSLSRYCPGSTYWLPAHALPLPAEEVE